ncbi:MAG: CHAD domain-containing protein [Planctomycetaceae bacterium]|nr:CHAD domain-containing protein [Planctomycetaceae bacterium]
MAYRLRQSKSVQTSLRKVATEQIDKAIDEINDADLDAHETVHQVRKRCKKLRGLIRLVRPVFDDYQDENTCFRDAARALSDIRDAQSQLECLDDLRSYYERPLDDTAFSSLQQQLTKNRDRAAEEAGDLDEKLGEFLHTMQTAKQRVAEWTIL